MNLGIRLRILWELYSPVRLLLISYVVVVILGVMVEGMALAAIVPLIEAGEGGIGGFYGRLIDIVGLDASSDVSLVIVVGGLFVLRAITQYGSKLLAGTMVRRQTVRLQVDLFRSYLALRWETALRISQGEVNLLLTTQTQKAAQFLRKSVTLLEGAIYSVGLTAVAVLVSPENTLIAVGLIGASAIGVTIIATRIRQYADQVLTATKSQAGVLLQYARGVQMLRAFTVTDNAVRDVEDLAVERERLLYRSERVKALASVLPDLVFVLALLAVVALAFRAGDGLAEVGAIVALLFRVSQYLKRFSDLAALSELVPAVKDIHHHQRLFAKNVSQRLEATAGPELVPGEVVLDSLRFRYDTADGVAVDGITNRIASGEFIGVVGSSGSGKSTLISLIVGLLEPQEGRVRVGLSRTSMRRLAYVPQSPFVLKGSIASNVRWFRDIPDQRVAEACEDAGLGDLLRRLPEGVHTEVEQEGLTLSGGERQRLAMARALAGDPEILVLDEATSALDSESEAAIQRALDEMHGSVTVIAVAHRLSTVLSADRIWVLENGRITEDAPASELLRTEGSRFAALGSLQGLRSED